MHERAFCRSPSLLGQCHRAWVHTSASCCNDTPTRRQQLPGRPDPATNRQRFWWQMQPATPISGGSGRQGVVGVGGARRGGTSSIAIGYERAAGPWTRLRLSPPDLRPLEPKGLRTLNCLVWSSPRSVAGSKLGPQQDLKLLRFTGRRAASQELRATGPKNRRATEPKNRRTAFTR